MSLIPLPKLDLDIKATIADFLSVRREINAKLDILVSQGAGARLGEALVNAEECDPDDPALQAEPIRLQ